MSDPKVIHARGRRTVTADQLEEMQACRHQVEIFRNEWPKGTTISRKSVQRALELKLDLDWYMDQQPEEIRHAYRKAIQPHMEAYEKAIQPHMEAYRKARITAMLKALRGLVRLP